MCPSKKQGPSINTDHLMDGCLYFQHKYTLLGVRSSVDKLVPNTETISLGPGDTFPFPKTASLGQNTTSCQLGRKLSPSDWVKLEYFTYLENSGITRGFLTIMKHSTCSLSSSCYIPLLYSHTALIPVPAWVKKTHQGCRNLLELLDKREVLTPCPCSVHKPPQTLLQETKAHLSHILLFQITCIFWKKNTRTFFFRSKKLWLPHKPWALPILVAPPLARPPAAVVAAVVGWRRLGHRPVVAGVEDLSSQMTLTEWQVESLTLVGCNAITLFHQLSAPKNKSISHIFVHL